MTDLSDIEVLAFDVGGTVIDWHSGVSTQLAAFGSERGIDHDWVGFTKAWRKRALARALNARTVDLPGGNIDGVHRETLDATLAEAGLEDVSAADRDRLTLVWHNFDPWPDSAAGHARLREKFVMATLTILSVALIVDVSRRAPFHWDAVISCEMLEEYKLRPSAYRRGVELLQRPPERVMMVAAHMMDLEAARNEGLRTAFIRRPDEWGAGTTPEQTVAPWVDVVADGLEDLADKLGA